ncbi:MAG TPA: HAMP domain-containing sensor histidine kinase [Desulfatirhabdiaceae bacterium]|nr:HAMP domain-containing sensor histidine kinase [Desulfatirhabdiaceae bacterium]
MSEQKNQTPDQGQFFREMQIELLIHDLKDPVAVIETGVRSLLDRRETNGPLSHRQEKTLKRVLRNAQKTRSMMYNLLEIGRSQAGCFNCMAFSPVYVMFESLMEAIETQCSAIHEQVSACSDSLEQLRILKENGIHLQVDADMAAFEMIQDKTKFSQIVGNLIKNALYYRKERLNIRMDHIAGLLTVEVQDDGPGIDSKHHETVFQRYTQVKASENLSRNGHGLGLAGARIMARSMNGDVSVFCDKGMGTVFRLVLPVS